MEKIKDKNKYMILALLLLMLVVIGATYAYFTAQKGSGGSAQIEVGAGTTDSLTFSNDDGKIEIIANQDNFSKSDKSITEKASVKAKLIPNNNTNQAHETYNIFLVVENNDLVYTKNSSTPELLLKITDPNNGEYTKTVDGLQYYENVTDREDTEYQGYDITTSNNQVYKIVSDYPIEAETEAGVEQTWQVEATLVNLNQDQNVNTGKTFEGSIYITTENELELSEINTLKTTATATSIEAVAEITTGTSEIATYYFAIEKTDETPEDIKLSSIANALSKTYETETESNTHVFSENIEADQNYKIYTYVEDAKGYKSNIYETVVTSKDGEIPEVGEYNTSVTPSSITITYPNNEILNYHAKVDGGKWTDYDKTTNTITGLKENTTYKILIQAKDDADLLSNIRIIKITTGEIPKQNLSDFIISKVDQPVGSGNEKLLHHTTYLPNSAADNSYRYSGDDPYNFVCFGTGSEEYNNGGTVCPDTNLYRIIGVFNNQVKLIKSEYIVGDELGLTSAGKPATGAYDSLKRIRNTVTEGFFWNQSSDNTWKNSTLKEALNGEYLNKLGAWDSKIALMTWYAGGHNTNKVTPKMIYDIEMTSETTLSAKIGLMYLSDYGFASEQNSWESTLSDYKDTNNENRANNWLFNNVYEWTIQPNSNNQTTAYLIDNGADVNSSYVDKNIVSGVRPVFYLNSDVQVKVDSSIGDASNPFRIVI